MEIDAKGNPNLFPGRASSLYTVETYEDDRPYPSVLVFGRTESGRPLHVVIAYDKDDDIAVIITVYQPDPARWIDFRRRRL